MGGDRSRMLCSTIHRSYSHDCRKWRHSLDSLKWAKPPWCMNNTDALYDRLGVVAVVI